jgi:hypothetical protein
VLLEGYWRKGKEAEQSINGYESKGSPNVEFLR